MILTVDIGNTRIKGAVFEQYTLVEFFVFEVEELRKKIENILKKYPNLKHLVVSSVGNLEKELFLAFESKLKVHFVSHKDTFPFYK